MQVINADLVSGKKVLLRLDIDVSIENGQVQEGFRLKAGLPTLRLCLENASQVVVIGHIGRPEGEVVPELSVEPIKQWFISQGLNSSKLEILENLRFDPREEAGDLEFAKELASRGDVFVNEAFASYRPAVSTTILPTLLPSYAGLQFAAEVNKLTEVRNNPKKPLVVIMGGAKVKDKLPVIEVFAQKADAVLVGGKLVAEIREQDLSLPNNVMIGKLSEDGFDIAYTTLQSWENLINRAVMIVWNGPVGKFEDLKNDQSAKLARIILSTHAEIIVGGGDTISLLGSLGILEDYQRKAFVSVGGGAMLKFLSDGTLPTIEALK